MIQDKETYEEFKRKEKQVSQIGYGFRESNKNMKYYLGPVRAEPMTLGDFSKRQNWPEKDINSPEREGYRIRYFDGHHSWYPKDQFEKYFKETEWIQ